MDWESYDRVIGTISLISGVLFGIAFILALLQPFDMQQLIAMVFFLATSIFLISIYRAAKKGPLAIWQRIPAILLTIALVVWIGTFVFGIYLILSGKLY